MKNKVTNKKDQAIATKLLNVLPLCCEIILREDMAIEISASI